MSGSDGPEPKNFLLVHGALHGAWCWEKLVPFLKARGHRVLVIDLPGRGDDPIRGWKAKFSHFVDRVRGGASRMEGPVIAVGHSWGGFVISGAAEAEPAAFDRLIYLAAFAPRSGDSAASLVARNPKPTAKGSWSNNLLRGELLPNASDAAFAFYNTCSQEDQNWAVARLRPEPIRPMLRKITLTSERFGSVPKAYIRCLQDHAISLAAQDQMIEDHAIDSVISLDTDHSPFLGAPELCADALVRAGMLPV